MLKLFILFWLAIRAWWGELLFLLALNFIWLLAQLTVILGPPSTVALYTVAQRVLDKDIVDFGDFWQALKENFGRSWIWGAAQIVIYLVLVYNLFFYAGKEGVVYLALRYAWTLLLLFWFAINLYYWPLYLAQTDRRFTTTLSNAAKMALINPGYTIAYSLLALLFIVGSMISGLLLGAVMGVWLALWGTRVVQDRMASQV